MTTPDPRLDVIERAMVLALEQNWTVPETARCIRDALDDHAAVQATREPDFGWQTLEAAPAGLSAAQQIRLRVFEECGPTGDKTIDEWAAWVEHGPVETAPPDDSLHPDSDHLIRLLDAACNRADLAEARLGHIADALRAFDDSESSEDFLVATSKFEIVVRDALAWTPDDTVLCSRCGQNIEGAHGEGFCVDTAPTGGGDG